MMSVDCKLCLLLGSNDDEFSYDLIVDVVMQITNSINKKCDSSKTPYLSMYLTYSFQSTTFC